MGAAGGHAFLVDTNSNLTSCTDASIVDKIGYGSGDCPEATTAAAHGAGFSLERLPGSTDPLCGNGIVFMQILPPPDDTHLLIQTARRGEQQLTNYIGHNRLAKNESIKVVLFVKPRAAAAPVTWLLISTTEQSLQERSK